MADIEFINGLIFKLPHPNAPDFVRGKISIKRQALIDWLSARNDEWVNIDLKVSKEGKAYACVDQWKPNQQPTNFHNNTGGQFIPQQEQPAQAGWPPQQFVSPQPPQDERYYPPDDGFDSSQIPF